MLTCSSNNGKGSIKYANSLYQRETLSVGWKDAEVLKSLNDQLSKVCTLEHAYCNNARMKLLTASKLLF